MRGPGWLGRAAPPDCPFPAAGAHRTLSRHHRARGRRRIPPGAGAGVRHLTRDYPPHLTKWGWAADHHDPSGIGMISRIGAKGKSWPPPSTHARSRALDAHYGPRSQPVAMKGVTREAVATVTSSCRGSFATLIRTPSRRSSPRRRVRRPATRRTLLVALLRANVRVGAGPCHAVPARRRRGGVSRGGRAPRSWR